jgi:hypothetical protein
MSIPPFFGKKCEEILEIMVFGNLPQDPKLDMTLRGMK